jgi:hypothetical protein
MDIDVERTHVHMISDLLDYIVDWQYAEEVNIACHCHPEYVRCCPCCRSKQEERHGDDCRLYSLMKEVKAYLEVENDLAKSRGDDYIYVPYFREI